MYGKKRWIIKNFREKYADEIGKISEELGISELTASLLFGRGYKTPEASRSFLQRDDEFFHDPMLLADMDKAVRRVTQAIRCGERVTVYGDYDVDGVTAVSILYLYLKSKGVDIHYYIPERASEGYGVNRGAVKRIAERGSSLIITVDTGITAVAETEYASSVGVDMVITDHHECHGELPEAYAIVNPHRPDCRYPFKELAGVGVAFKLVCALESVLNPDDDRYLHRICSQYADIVAVGTVADVMPLIGENRLIVSIGLKLIEEGSRCGLSALCDASSGAEHRNSRGGAKKKKITASFIGYTLAPRINAAGRIRSASLAAELFLTEDPDRAREIAGMLCEINRERQECENMMAEEAYRMIEQTHDFEHDRVIVLSSENWHHGIIGIVASRITDRYGLPSILISFDGGRITDGITDDDVGKGSGRSIKGMNLAEGLAACGEYLVKAGGHEMAAGLSIKRGELESFREAINEYAANVLTDEDLIPAIEADEEVTLSELSIKSVDELGLLEPYGVANSAPVFVLRNVKITDIAAIGLGKHTRFIAEYGGIAVTAVYFGKNPSALGIYRGDTADVLFSPDINEFRGIKSVQLLVKDVRVCGRTLKERCAMIAEYDRIISNRSSMIDESFVPLRSDFKNVYLYIRRELRLCGDAPVNIYQIMKNTVGESVSAYVRLRFIIDILVQTGIVSFYGDPDYSTDGGTLPLTVNNVEVKVDLKASEIYQSLLPRIRGHNRADI